MTCIIYGSSIVTVRTREQFGHVYHGGSSGPPESSGGSRVVKAHGEKGKVG